MHLPARLHWRRPRPVRRDVRIHDVLAKHLLLFVYNHNVAQ